MTQNTTRYHCIYRVYFTPLSFEMLAPWILASIFPFHSWFCSFEKNVFLYYFTYSFHYPTFLATLEKFIIIFSIRERERFLHVNRDKSSGTFVDFPERGGRLFIHLWSLCLEMVPYWYPALHEWVEGVVQKDEKMRHFLLTLHNCENYPW